MMTLIYAHVHAHAPRPINGATSPLLFAYKFAQSLGSSVNHFIEKVQTSPPVRSRKTFDVCKFAQLNRILCALAVADALGLCTSCCVPRCSVHGAPSYCSG